MTVITIPKKLAEKGEFIVMPRKRYEELRQLEKLIPIVKPTKAEVRAIRRSEKEFRMGEYVSWEELKHELAHRRR